MLLPLTFLGRGKNRCYINGKERKTVLGWGPAEADPLPLKGPIDIGACWAGQDHLFNGVIDEVQIYRGIFSQKELQKIIQARLVVQLLMLLRIQVSKVCII